MQFSSAGFFPYPQEKRHNKLFFFFFLTNASGREKWGWRRYFSYIRV